MDNVPRVAVYSGLGGQIPHNADRTHKANIKFPISVRACGKPESAKPNFRLLEGAENKIATATTDEEIGQLGKALHRQPEEKACSLAESIVHNS